MVDLCVHWAGRGELRRLDVPVSSYGAPDTATITIGPGIALAG